MVVLPAGSFTMGTPDDEVGRQPDEGPLHDVTFAKPFAISRYQITAGELDAYLKATGVRLADGDCRRPRMHRRQAALPARPSPAGGVRRLQRREELRRLAVEEDRQALPHAQRGRARVRRPRRQRRAPSPSRSTKARNTASPSTPTPTAPAMATTSPRRWAASAQRLRRLRHARQRLRVGRRLLARPLQRRPERRQRVDGGKVRAGADPRQRLGEPPIFSRSGNRNNGPQRPRRLDRLPRGARTLTQNEEGRSDDTAPAFSNPSKEPGSELLGEQRQPFVQGREQAVVEVVPAQLEDGVVGEISVFSTSWNTSPESMPLST